MRVETSFMPTLRKPPFDFAQDRLRAGTHIRVVLDKTKRAPPASTLLKYQKGPEKRIAARRAWHVHGTDRRVADFKTNLLILDEALRVALGVHVFAHYAAWNGSAV